MIFCRNVPTTNARRSIKALKMRNFA